MPVHEAPETAFAVYTVLMFVVTGGILLWWALSKERERGPALPLILLGGAVAGVLEPFLDNLVLVWWPPDQDLGAFQAFGRTVPIFVLIGYSWFCGGLLYFTARLYERGVTARQVWAILGAVVIVDYVGIGLPTWLDMMGFYGDPPMSVTGYPVWWAAIDGTDVILGGAVLFFLMPRLRGWTQLYLVLVPPIMIGASAGAVGWPIGTALNSGWSQPAKWIAAAMTIGLACAIVHLVARFVPEASRQQAPELELVAS